MRRTKALFVAGVALAFVACSDAEPDPIADDVGTHTNSDTNPSRDGALADADRPTDPDAGSDGGSDGCEPSREAWDQNAKGFVETYCAECHGAQPEFGAPYSLLDYDELLAGAPGERKVDRMAERLLDGSMPPATATQPDHVALDTLVEWATCGQEHADHSDGLLASAPAWEAPEDPPANTDSFDVTAGGFEVGPNQLDHYQCFVVEAPIDATQFIRRFEPIVDDARVVHHLLVGIDRSDSVQGDSFSCGGFPPGDGYVYVWAPGQEAIQFDDGGLRLDPGDKFVLQIHYNNGAGAEDVSDSSGFRVFHAEPSGTEYGLASIGPLGIYVQPESTGRASSACTVQRETFIRATWPHMHEIGSAFETVIEREDGTEETLIDLTGWSFEAQIIYDTPTTVYPDDRLRTTCNFDNPYDFAVMFGEGTQDEMCFNFMYISPPADSPCQ